MNNNNLKTSGKETFVKAIKLFNKKMIENKFLLFIVISITFMFIATHTLIQILSCGAFSYLLISIFVLMLIPVILSGIFCLPQIHWNLNRFINHFIFFFILTTLIMIFINLRYILGLAIGIATN